MWKDFSAGYIKNNRASCLSIRIAAFISALLLSLLCGLFYNVWKYEVERIQLEEGGWQSRMIVELDQIDTGLENIDHENIGQKNIDQRDIMQKNIDQGNIIQKNIDQKNIIQKNIVQKNIIQNNRDQGNRERKGAEQKNIKSKETKQEEVNQYYLETIKNFANVKDAVINESEGKGIEVENGEIEKNQIEKDQIKKDQIEKDQIKKDQIENDRIEKDQIVIDIYFDDMRAVLSDTPHIAKQIGVTPDQIIYNYQLLAMYLIRDAGDTAPRLVFPMFLLVTVLASFSLIIIIHNSFAVSMNARVHQFGIFSSIGATPKQIRTCLLHEAAALSAVPVITGNLLGIVSSMGLIQMTNILLGNDGSQRHKAVFGYHPMVLILTLLVTAITIWISAWLPARKLSRLTPLEAIKNTGELQLKCKKNALILTHLFGVEGELAGSAIKAQKRALRTASLSLVFSVLAFTVMQCFFSLSGISTRETYFEKYQNVWDLMAEVKDAGLDAFAEIEAVQGLDGVESAIAYQKASAKRIITEEEMSDGMKAFGGFSNAPDQYVAETESGWLVNVPIVILDDHSFLNYCRQISIAPQLDGAVVRNQIRDVTNPDFRHPDFVPYVKEESSVSVLRQSESGEKTAAIKVLSYTDEVPVLREEYATLDYYELVHFIPLSLWKDIKEQIGGIEIEEDVYICVLGSKNAALDELDELQNRMEQMLGKYTVVYENRIQEYEVNQKQIQGMMVILGGFCVLLALIGIGNVFSNTLGFVRQRKREFARYISVGLTPEGIRKMFCIEAVVVAGRPILLAFPAAAAAVWYMLKLSYLDAAEFLAEAPLVPVGVFMLAVLGAAALAYYLAWRGVRSINLAEVLRDDTMM